MQLGFKLDVSQRYLVGVSGGRDSVALLDWLLQTGVKKVVVCHLNHGLRGIDSGQDAAFVRRLAERHELPVEVEKVLVKKLVAREGGSVEAVARQQRYEFFAKCGRKHRIPRVVLGHHQDDQAETVLFNLLRGSAGLRGMNSVSERRIMGYQLTLLRPMLGVSRVEIDEYVRVRGLSYREDQTNQLGVATRNRLRHEVLPLLSEVMERDVKVSLVRAAAQQGDIDEALAGILHSLELLDPQERLYLPKLQRVSPAIQRQALYQYLKQQKVMDIDRAMLERARDLVLPGGAPALTLPGGRQLRRRQKRLFIEGGG